jgi:hypothetical protein
MALQAPQYPPEIQRPDNTRGVHKADLVVPGARRGIAEERSTLARTQHGKPFLGSGDLVVVENIDDVIWRFEWDRRMYDLRPGATMQIPFPAVINLLGDPRSIEGGEIKFRTETGQSGIIGSRYDTLLMLMARFGVKDENIDALVDFAPKMRVTTTTGTDIVFPAQNPRCPAWPTPNAPEPGREQPTDMRQLVERYESERAETQAELGELRQLVTTLMGGQAAPQGVPDPVQPPAGPRATSAAAEALMGVVPPEEVEVGGAVPDTGPRSQV